jgi:general secretion pathway protein J
MLVSLALTALIAVLLVQSLQATGLITRRTTAMSAQAEVEIVREHLRQMLAAPAARRLNGRRPVFAGMPDQMTAVIASDRDAERGAELRVALVVHPRSDADLDLAEQRRLEFEPQGPTTSDLLLEHVSRLRMRYFGSQGFDQQPHWQDRWMRRDGSPSFIEITIDFPPDDRRHWAPLIVPFGFPS